MSLVNIQITSLHIEFIAILIYSGRQNYPTTSCSLRTALYCFILAEDGSLPGETSCKQDLEILG